MSLTVPLPERALQSMLIALPSLSPPKAPTMSRAHSAQSGQVLGPVNMPDLPVPAQMQRSASASSTSSLSVQASALPLWKCLVPISCSAAAMETYVLGAGASASESSLETMGLIRTASGALIARSSTSAQGLAPTSQPSGSGSVSSSGSSRMAQTSQPSGSAAPSSSSSSPLPQTSSSSRSAATAMTADDADEDGEDYLRPNA